MGAIELEQLESFFERHRFDPAMDDILLYVYLLFTVNIFQLNLDQGLRETKASLRVSMYVSVRSNGSLQRYMCVHRV